MIRPSQRAGGIRCVPLASAAFGAPPWASRSRDSLVVVADQMRADYLARFDGGGIIRRLRERGFTTSTAQAHLPRRRDPDTRAPPGAPPSVTDPGNTSSLRTMRARRRARALRPDPSAPDLGASGAPRRGGA